MSPEAVGDFVLRAGLVAMLLEELGLPRTAPNVERVLAALRECERC